MLLAARADAAECSCAAVDPAIETLLGQGKADEALPRAEAALRQSDTLPVHLCRARVLLSRAAHEGVVVDEQALGLLPGESGTVSVTPEMAEKAFRSETRLDPEAAAPGIAELESIVTRWPSDPAAHRCLLEVHQTLDDGPGFARVLTRATKSLAPLGADAIDELLPWTSKFVERGQVDRAEEAYRILVNAYPKSEKAQSGLGVVMIKRGRLDEAAAYFARAHALAPRDTIVLWNSASAAVYQRDFAKARQAFEEIAAIEPAATDVHFELAMLALADGPKAGIAGLERYLERHAKAPQGDGWGDNARAILEGLKGDGSSEQLESLAAQLVHMGRSLQAIPMLVGVVTREPKRAAPRFLLAQAYDVDGFQAIAFEELRGMEPLLSPQPGPGEPPPASLHYELGRLALHLGRNEDSARYLEKSVAEDPERGDTHYTLGLAFDRLGQHERSHDAFAHCLSAKRPSRYRAYCERALKPTQAQPPAAKR